MRLQMRLYAVQARDDVVDLREASRADPRIVDPDDYGYAQSIGRKLRNEGEQGILYPSVRHAGGECMAALRTGILKNWGLRERVWVNLHAVY